MESADRLSDLPECILLYILSLLPDSKLVVRTSVLSTRWRFLWKSVPLSLQFHCSPMSEEKEMFIFVASINRRVYYWKSCQNIRTFSLVGIMYNESYVKDFDLWVHFAIKVANVEDFTLKISITFSGFDYTYDGEAYVFPQFAYKSTWLKHLTLRNCQLKPVGSVNWSSLLSLSIRGMNVTNVIMEKVLSGCPNLERLELADVRGIGCLEISSLKLSELTLIDMPEHLDILAPYIQTLTLLGSCLWTLPRNVPPLVSARVHLSFDYLQHEIKDYVEHCSYVKELFKSVAHVTNLELSNWCTQCLFVLELEGWQSPSWKFLKLNSAVELSDFPGFCSFLHWSSDLESLVINWYNCRIFEESLLYIIVKEWSRRVETHIFDYSLVHLKTIKIICSLYGLLREKKSILPVAKYLLKNASVLEEFIIVVRLGGRTVTQDHVKMEQEFLSLPRSSLHASIGFSYL